LQPIRSRLFDLVLVLWTALFAPAARLTIPVFGWFLRNPPMILIDRENSTTAMRNMVEGSRAALGPFTGFYTGRQAARSWSRFISNQLVRSVTHELGSRNYKQVQIPGDHRVNSVTRATPPEL
jgi:hypothetical protein